MSRGVGEATLFLCGDVMTGRGIDQVLPHPCDPGLHEPWVDDARDYVRLAQKVSGTIPRPLQPRLLWGDALAELERQSPQCRLINLETTLTTSPHFWPEKGVHYRMHPHNSFCLNAAGIDACALANNHILDWGYQGLAETLNTLSGAGLHWAGASLDQGQAGEPAVLPLNGQRLWFWSLGSQSSGIPSRWAATAVRPGINLMDEHSLASADRLAEEIDARREKDDRVVVSVHWGGNWGFDIPRAQRDWAHRLIESGVVDVLHGHSSHHPRGLEFYRGKLILYGCGDFINDYEGISGHRSYRPDLGVMFFPHLDERGDCRSLSLTPVARRRFQLHYAGEEAGRWLSDMLKQHSPGPLSVQPGGQGRLEILPWPGFMRKPGGTL